MGHAWVAQPVECLTLAQIMISGPGLSPASGSVLSGESTCPSPSAPPPTHVFSLSQINTIFKKLFLYIFPMANSDTFIYLL